MWCIPFSYTGDSFGSSARFDLGGFWTSGFDGTFKVPYQWDNQLHTAACTSDVANPVGTSAYFWYRFGPDDTNTKGLVFPAEPLSVYISNSDGRVPATGTGLDFVPFGAYVSPAAGNPTSSVACSNQPNLDAINSAFPGQEYLLYCPVDATNKFLTIYSATADRRMCIGEIKFCLTSPPSPPASPSPPSPPPPSPPPISPPPLPPPLGPLPHSPPAPESPPPVNPLPRHPPPLTPPGHPPSSPPPSLPPSVPPTTPPPLVPPSVPPVTPPPSVPPPSTPPDPWSQFNIKPNIIFNFVDDAGWQDWPLTAGREAGYEAGAYGDFRYRGTYPRSIMADIEDIFVRDGIQLTRMYSPSICGPSRRALFTGRDFQQHGVHNNDCPSVPLNMKLLPTELDRAGYSVGMYGKYHLGFMQEEALPGNKGIEDARVFLRGSVNHEGHHSNGRGDGTCTISPGAGVLSSLHGGGSHSHIFDHTVTTNYKDHYNDAGAGYQFLTNPANRPSPRCGNCTEGDDEWGQSIKNDHGMTQHLGSMVRDLAIARIMNHDFENKDKPLALFLTWSGPHLPHTPEGLVSSATVEAAHCAQEILDGNACSGDQYFSQQRYAQRQFKDTAYTARSGCPIPNSNYYHSQYEAMVAEISLYLGKIKEALVAKTDASTATMWDETLMIFQSDNGGVSFPPVQTTRNHKSAIDLCVFHYVYRHRCSITRCAEANSHHSKVRDSIKPHLTSTMHSSDVPVRIRWHPCTRGHRWRNRPLVDAR